MQDFSIRNCTVGNAFFKQKEKKVIYDNTNTYCDIKYYCMFCQNDFINPFCVPKNTQVQAFNPCSFNH